MVVSDNYRQATFLCIRDLCRSCNSIITGDDRVNPILHCFLDKLFMDSISIFDPVRNIGVRIRPQSLESFEQNAGRGNAVYIIIPDNPDFSVFFYFFLKDLHCFVHVFQKPR